MELDIYELYVVHWMRNKIMNLINEDETNHYILANELLYELEKRILKEIINQLDDKSLFSYYTNQL